MEDAQCYGECTVLQRMCAVLWTMFSTLEDIEYFGGCKVLESVQYYEGCSVLWGIPSVQWRKFSIVEETHKT